MDFRASDLLCVWDGIVVKNLPNGLRPPRKLKTK